MESQAIRRPRAIGLTTVVRAAVVALALANVHCARMKLPPANRQPPMANQPAGPAPHVIFSERTRQQPPPLCGRGEDARRTTLSFIEWAGTSTVSEREQARTLINSPCHNPRVVQTLQDEIMKAKDTDHSRALLCLAILGEMRSPLAERFLRDFISQPLPDPTSEPIAEGESVPVTALASLQAKAVDGLAYLHSRSADEFVLATISKHPSRIVRAEAINAFLWNATDARVARRRVLRAVRKGEEIFVDRVRMEDGEKAATFNAKLDVFLRAHPEVMPPAPEKTQPHDAKPTHTEDAQPRRPGW